MGRGVERHEIKLMPHVTIIMAFSCHPLQHTHTLSVVRRGMTPWPAQQQTIQVLPHAFSQVRNFILASIAEGRNFEEEEDGMKRGDTLRCLLTLSDVDTALTPKPLDLSDKTAHHTDVNVDDFRNQSTRMWNSTNLALQLGNLTRVCVDTAVNKKTASSNLVGLN